MTADIEIPASGLVDTRVAAQLAGVAPVTIRQWKNRGHLDIARDTDGMPLLSNQGRHLFEVMAVIDAEYKLRQKARRAPINYAA